MSSERHWAVLADGDDVGALLERFAIEGDLAGYIATSKRISHERETLAAWFESIGASVELSVADTVIATGSGNAPLTIDLKLRRPTWSFGLGCDLSSAHAALAVAKASGKNCLIDGRSWGSLNPRF